MSFLISVARIVIALFVFEVVFFLIKKIWKLTTKMIGLVVLYARGRKMTKEAHSVQV